MVNHQASEPGRAAVTEGDSIPSTGRAIALARILGGIVLFGLVLAACIREWSDVRAVVAALSPGDLVASEALVLVGLFASVLTWRRVLRELGHPVTVPEASKIYLIGQLGKYIPGSVWALIVQMELARKVGVPRLSSIAASTLTVLFNLVVGLTIGVVAVPAVADGRVWRYGVLAALFLLGVALLLPPVHRWVHERLFRSTAREAVGRRMSWRGTGVALGWSFLSWCSYGAALTVLVAATTELTFHAFWLSVSGLALAMTAGFVIVVSPAGIGVREAVVVAALSPVLGAGRALGIALVLRLLFTIADLLAAAIALPIRLALPAEVPAPEQDILEPVDEQEAFEPVAEQGVLERAGIGS